jgi:chromosome segregation ATPase
LAKDTKTLNERFVVLKTKSQTFKDYKVIKETVLDAYWVLIMDSVKAQKASIVKARQSIAALDTSLVGIKRQLQQKQDSMEQVEHASTHITVLGIDFQKGVFLTFIGIFLAALVVVIGVVLARLKMIHRSYKEKADTVDELNHEYEEFKRKAMDKQTKLSRELQDERNKLQAMFKA